MGLEDLVAGLVGAITFIGSTAIVDVLSSALDKEEVSFPSFNSLLLLTLLSFEIGERLLSGLFFFFFSEGLDLTF